MKRIFVTGISTEVGKTIAAAIITEALQADYWKPVQAGDLEASDSHTIGRLITNSKTIIHPNSYALNTAMSPHAAARLDGITIDIKQIQEPTTSNHLVIEGAGGLLVPLNSTATVLDLIQPHYKLIVISRHYLGSINHSLLTIECLKQQGFDVNIIFSGNEHPSTERIILEKTGATYIGRIREEAAFNKKVIRKYAALFQGPLQLL